MNLYQYRFGKREGLILNWNEGWGEIAPMPGFSRETLEEATSEVLQFFDSGKTPTLPSVLWGLSNASKPYDASAIELPLCAFQKPFSGCSHLKIKVGHLTLDEAILLTREYVGRYQLRIDCNRAWSLKEAITFANEFKKEEFDYIEEPVKNFEDLVKFSEITQFPVGIDESFREKAPYWTLPTLKAIVIKPMLSELPTLPQKVSLVLSSSFETSLGILQIARIGSPEIQHGLHTFEDDLLIPPLRAERGLLCAERHVIDQRKLCLIASRN